MVLLLCSLEMAKIATIIGGSIVAIATITHAEGLEGKVNYTPADTVNVVDKVMENDSIQYVVSFNGAYHSIPINSDGAGYLTQSELVDRFYINVPIKSKLLLGIGYVLNFTHLTKIPERGIIDMKRDYADSTFTENNTKLKLKECDKTLLDVLKDYQGRVRCSSAGDSVTYKGVIVNAGKQKTNDIIVKTIRSGNDFHISRVYSARGLIEEGHGIKEIKQVWFLKDIRNKIPIIRMVVILKNGTADMTSMYLKENGNR